MEIYAFGSIVRGQIDKYSDIDLLIIKDFHEDITYVDKEQYSIYTFNRIMEIWKEGNPFAWHLYKESKCIYTKENISFISSLGTPNTYKNAQNDLQKFYDLFLESRKSIDENKYSTDFDLSMIFLAIRNFASCFALGRLNIFEFSRDSSLKLGEYSLSINKKIYHKLRDSRILSTRGIGEKITEDELENIFKELDKIENWFNKLIWMNF